MSEQQAQAQDQIQSKRIFLGNLPEDTNREHIKELVLSYGRPVNIELVQPNRRREDNQAGEGGQPKRGGARQAFCFITFLTHEDAAAAVNGLHGKQWRNSNLSSSWAKADTRQKNDNSGRDSWLVREEQRKKANQAKKQKKAARAPLPLSTLIPKPQVPKFPMPQKPPTSPSVPKSQTSPAAPKASKTSKPSYVDQSANGQDQEPSSQFDNDETIPESASEAPEAGDAPDPAPVSEFIHLPRFATPPKKAPKKSANPRPVSAKGNPKGNPKGKQTAKAGDANKPPLYRVTVKRLNVKGPADLVFDLTEEEVNSHLRPLAQEANKNRNRN